MSTRVRLGVNIDHVATIRNARGVSYPDPARAAVVALEAGADGITAHLREDRRHISDADIETLAAMLRDRERPLNLEMAVTSEMLAIALRHRPHAVCLVPERREERTTEGGLDVAAGHNWIAPFVEKLSANGSRVSLFIGADPAQIEAASRTGAAVVELHTGAYCDAARDGHEDEARRVLAALSAAARQAASLGLEVHAGHGIDYGTVSAIAAIPEVAELNIGHFLIGEAIFTGLGPAISEMRRLIDAARVDLQRAAP
ncbi:pyridoxine 5'-phosphate synthase [Candidatus Viadribacter manganicus]|uniref:Pyridoxine 5'-phosphate synthase n=1 Tax=Candidatus Viadribacter manganicus TaxID=1759059 RepID=A0A1B1ADL4_9PROT|nr:pyridoxine 5'-phosphate synthase [Candidatus Viadribacter manganicus]ANP44644.1 pyridoxine 5'-phosphate synthase [Candidatus Viadribacter manganicus]